MSVVQIVCGLPAPLAKSILKEKKQFNNPVQRLPAEYRGMEMIVCDRHSKET
jgi:hypothetical protein